MSVCCDEQLVVLTDIYDLLVVLNESGRLPQQPADTTLDNQIVVWDSTTGKYAAAESVESLEADPLFTFWLSTNPFTGYATESWVTSQNYATVGGTNKQIQYNNNGVLAGMPNLYDSATNTLTLNTNFEGHLTTGYFYFHSISTDGLEHTGIDVYGDSSWATTTIHNTASFDTNYNIVASSGVEKGRVVNSVYKYLKTGGGYVEKYMIADFDFFQLSWLAGTGTQMVVADSVGKLSRQAIPTPYTDADARAAISSTIAGINYNSTTGVFSLGVDNFIPTLTQATNWNTAYGWGNHASAGYALASSLGTIAAQNYNAVSITGGTINGTTIGATTPASIVATSIKNNGVLDTQVVFSAANVMTGSSNYTYDYTNNRLNIGVPTSTGRVNTRSSNNNGTTKPLVLQNSTPDDLFTFYDTGSFLIRNATGATVSTFTTNLTGKAFYYAQNKGGIVGGTNGAAGLWSEANIGIASFAWGEECRASNEAAIAMGYGATATGFASISLGVNSTNSASSTVVLGNLITNTAGYAIGSWITNSGYTFGAGISDANRLVNSTGNMYFGVGSTIPTMVIYAATGVGTTGSVTIGKRTGTVGSTSIVLGAGTTFSSATNTGSIAIGVEAGSTGVSALALGRYANVGTTNGVSLGSLTNLTSAAGAGSILIGSGLSGVDTLTYAGTENVIGIGAGSTKPLFFVGNFQTGQTSTASGYVVSTTSGSNVLTATGAGNDFTTSLRVGDAIYTSSGGIRTITAITSATTLTVDSNYTVTASGQSGFRNSDLGWFQNGAGTRKWTLDKSGNVSLGSTPYSGDGAGVMFIGNAVVAPTTTPTGGGHFHVIAGALYWKGSAGTLTLLANA